ncbi:Succinate dehydrogenase subunit 5 [Cardamine amara subsp. amara]|uniref:Succinate dehydrogenase subunit 5 n=1 Tax=Cardamine amara subsp. amara TaxID=228776 RepID=A0ABD1A294_CARAN
MVLLRSLCRTAAAASVAALRSSRSAASNQLLRNRFLVTRGFFAVSSSSPSNRTPNDLLYPRAMDIGQVRRFCEDWAELPSAAVHDAKSAISKNTDDKVGQEALKNVFRAAEAVEEFGGILTSIKMEIDDSIGMSGEGVKPLPNDITDALRTAYQRYAEYLDSFGSEEVYLKKKVEMELGTKMIHLKMRCSGLGSEWGKVTVLGTSGLSGSYVEQRA